VNALPAEELRVRVAFDQPAVNRQLESTDPDRRTPWMMPLISTGMSALVF
jgi:hypothetical protein